MRASKSLLARQQQLQWGIARLKLALEMEDLLHVFDLPPSSSHAMFMMLFQWCCGSGGALRWCCGGGASHRSCCRRPPELLLVLLTSMSPDCYCRRLLKLGRHLEHGAAEPGAWNSWSISIIPSGVLQ